MKKHPDTHRLPSLLAFLVLTFGATWTIEATLIANGMRFDTLDSLSGPALWLMGIMWIPGLAALLVTGIERKSFSALRETLRLRIGTSLGAYFLTIILVPLLFAGMYLLTWALGYGDFTPPLSQNADGVTMDSLLHVILPMSIVVGPFLNLFFGLGEEIGWRGFLLPRLMPLGKRYAYPLLGLLWGLWHAPLILAGFNYPGYPVAGILMMCLLCFAFGLFLNEMTLHYESSLLAGFIHGAVNAQGYGIWILLVPAAHPLLGGSVGLTGVIVWLVAGLICTRVLKCLN
ncbi:CPBP family intramembrane metalloprotease [Pseudodesulfovibrio sp. JC047]|uniref:CPBP family glutamic-type intramembrane protease n=1 Tax=Pseudodesulfovibrio sp. JC047 TaxID=2683199 RepID=UPI0013D71418|nr:CPBP family glutamic-type intramembrane protease [Pseudodesulfovibrio sp. JC047]NDV19595.1 CPBP family intramembrane metalloprotease [Pseudodesulfovibrio sp. JC047]